MKKSLGIIAFAAAAVAMPGSCQKEQITSNQKEQNTSNINSDHEASGLFTVRAEHTGPLENNGTKTALVDGDNPYVKWLSTDKISMWEFVDGTKNACFQTVCSPSATWAQTIERGSNTIPSGWTVVPDGALSGVFSVQDGEGKPITKVLFSQGNLKYVDGTPNGTWSFETKQYEFSTYPGNNDTPSDTYGLFGWGDAPTSGPVKTSADVDDYSWPSPGNPDPWGSKIDNNGTWRTLSSEEWTYLFNTRAASTVSGTENARYAKATVNSKAGIILLPDTYAHPEGVTALASINTEDAEFTANAYDSTNWEKMEAAGAVFLPAAGIRDGPYGVYFVGENGYYWSSTAYGDDYAYDVFFISNDETGDYVVNPGDYDCRTDGLSVRLITDVK